MNSKKTIILLVLMALIACFLLTGCVGLIKPSLGEISAAVEEAEAEAAQASEAGDASGESGDASGEASGESGDASGESGDASGEASGESGDASGESGDASGEASGEVAMEGNVLYRFEYTDQVSGSLGALSDLIIEVELYDTPNANGDTYLISVDLGGSVTTQTGTWTLEDGTFYLRIDDFRSYESRTIDGVPTILGIEYGSMMNRGMAEVPLVEGEYDVAEASGEAAEPAPAEAPAEASAPASGEASGDASGDASAS